MKFTSLYRHTYDLSRWLSNVLPSRKRLILIWIVLGLFISFVILGSINPTNSLPPGLYLKTPTELTIEKGSVVSFCLNRQAAKFAVERKYTDSKHVASLPKCPIETAPHLKRVAGVPGDTIEVNLNGVWINGKWQYPAPPNCDTNGRALPIHYGRHILQNKEYWVQTDFYMSYDSRVFGPIHKTQIFAEAYPLLVTPRNKTYSNKNREQYQKLNCSTLIETPDSLSVKSSSPVYASSSLEYRKILLKSNALGGVHPASPKYSFENIFFRRETD